MADLDSGEVKLPLDGEGKMLGILACDDAEGNKVVLKAFSGQVGGQWVIPGWCEPAFSVSDYSTILEETDRQVKELARQGKTSREISAEAMRRLFCLYRIHCIDGSVKTYSEIFGDILPPSGTGDCAAIKLLNCAFKNNLNPVCIQGALPVLSPLRREVQAPSQGDAGTGYPLPGSGDSGGEQTGRAPVGARKGRGEAGLCCQQG